MFPSKFEYDLCKSIQQLSLCFSWLESNNDQCICFVMPFLLVYHWHFYINKMISLVWSTYNVTSVCYFSLTVPFVCQITNYLSSVILFFSEIVVILCY